MSGSARAAGRTSWRRWVILELPAEGVRKPCKCGSHLECGVRSSEKDRQCCAQPICALHPPSSNETVFPSRHRKKSSVSDSFSNLVHRPTIDQFTEGVSSMCQALMGQKGLDAGPQIVIPEPPGSHFKAGRGRRVVYGLQTNLEQPRSQQRKG